MVTVLGFVLGRDSGFQQRLLDSAVADFPIIGDQVQDNIHGLRGSGVGLVVGLMVFARGARGLTQVTQHAMAEIWNIPGRQRPSFWARQVRGLLLLVVFAVGLAATSLLTWLGSYGEQAVAVALANLVAAATVNVGLFLLVFRVLTPQQIPTRQLLAGALVAGVAWQVLQAVGGYLVVHYLRHTSQVYGVFAIVLGLLFWLYLGAQLTLYAAEVNVVAARRLWPRSVLQPPLATDQHTRKTNPATPLPVAGHQQDLVAPQPPAPGQPATGARAMHQLVSERRKQGRAAILLVIPPAETGRSGAHWLDEPAYVSSQNRPG
jgi:uncharacterized BrkB/YihY/UPF0761 family membrane protein